MPFEISELNLKATPEATDEMETQISGNNASQKITLGSLTSILGSTAAQLYTHKPTIADDATYTVPDFSTTNAKAIMFVVTNHNGFSVDGNAILEIASNNIFTIYFDGLNWVNKGTGVLTDDGKINIAIDNGFTPAQVNVTNRSGFSRVFRFFIFSFDDGA